MMWPSSIQPNNLFVGPFSADAKLKFEIYISNGFRELPRNGLILVGICVLRWPRSNRPKVVKFWLLAQFIDPFYADVNLKYERCNFNGYRGKLKRDTPIEVELCRTSIGVTHSWHISWLGVVILSYLRCHGPIILCPRSYRVSSLFLLTLAVSFISPFRGI